MKALEYAAVALCVLAFAVVGHIYLEKLSKETYEVRIMELETKVSDLAVEKQEAIKEMHDSNMKLLRCQGPGLKLEEVTSK